jgi:multicomponent Na+:H+ antiporter subunit F
MTLGTYVALGILGVAAVVGLLRIVRKSTLGDRAVAFDMITSIITCGLLVGAALLDDALFLDAAVVLGLLGFVATVTIARFIESRHEGDL